MATYLRPQDPPRVIAALTITAAQVVDLRQPETLRCLALTGAEPSVEWQPQRSQGMPATSWLASDVARATGVDGMVYTSRKDPSRWHLVLFHWNQPGRASVTPVGLPLEFHP